MNAIPIPIPEYTSITQKKIFKYSLKAVVYYDEFYLYYNVF
jgi:hypothetical protein